MRKRRVWVNASYREGGTEHLRAKGCCSDGGLGAEYSRGEAKGLKCSVEQRPDPSAGARNLRNVQILKGYRALGLKGHDLSPSVL